MFARKLDSNVKTESGSNSYLKRKAKTEVVAYITRTATLTLHNITVEFFNSVLT